MLQTVCCGLSSQAMSGVRAIDTMLIDDLFGMGADMYAIFPIVPSRNFLLMSEISISMISMPKMELPSPGGCIGFLKTVDKATVVRTLNALWEYREALWQRSGEEDTLKNAHGAL